MRDGQRGALGRRAGPPGRVAGRPRPGGPGRLRGPGGPGGRSAAPARRPADRGPGGAAAVAAVTVRRAHRRAAGRWRSPRPGWTRCAGSRHAAGGATVNDAVLTVVAGGLRRWLEAHHGHLGEVRVKVPVSLHHSRRGPVSGAGPVRGRQPGNRDSFFCLDLPLGSADPLERLAAIHQATRVRKAGPRRAAPRRAHARARRASRGSASSPSGCSSHAAVLRAERVQRARSPPARSGCSGARSAAMYSLAEIGEHHALRIAVVSLAGTLNFGLVADPTLLDDVGQLAAGLQAEAAALARPAARLSRRHRRRGRRKIGRMSDQRDRGGSPPCWPTWPRAASRPRTAGSRCCPHRRRATRACSGSPRTRSCSPTPTRPG